MYGSSPFGGQAFGMNDPRLLPMMQQMAPGLMPGPTPQFPLQSVPGFRPPTPPGAPGMQAPMGLPDNGFSNGMGMLGMGLGMLGRNPGDGYITPPTPADQLSPIPADQTSAPGVGPIEPALAGGGSVGLSGGPFSGFGSWLRGLF